MNEEVIINETVIATMFEEIILLFGNIYGTGIILWNWLTTPLIETADAEALGFLGDLASYTPFGLIFGIGIFVILIYQLVKFILPI